MFKLRKSVLYGGPQNSIVLDFLTRDVVQSHTQFHEKRASTLVCCIVLVFNWECFGLCNFAYMVFILFLLFPVHYTCLFSYIYTCSLH